MVRIFGSCEHRILDRLSRVQGRLEFTIKTHSTSMVMWLNTSQKTWASRQNRVIEGSNLEFRILLSKWMSSFVQGRSCSPRLPSNNITTQSVFDGWHVYNTRHENSDWKIHYFEIFLDKNGHRPHFSWPDNSASLCFKESIWSLNQTLKVLAMMIRIWLFSFKSYLL